MSCPQGFHELQRIATLSCPGGDQELLELIETKVSRLKNTLAGVIQLSVEYLSDQRGEIGFLETHPNRQFSYVKNFGVLVMGGHEVTVQAVGKIVFKSTS